MDSCQLKPVLVLEDQVLIAMYVEELLREAGYRDIMTYSSCAAASAWLDHNKPHIVVMETKLRDGSCDDVAADLAERGIPFIVHTVERDGSGTHPRLNARCRWIMKPCDADEFVTTVKEHALV